MFSHSLRGRPSDGRANHTVRSQHVAEAEQFAETTQSKWLQAETLRLRGDLMLIVGDFAEAEASFLGAISPRTTAGRKVV